MKSKFIKYFFINILFLGLLAPLYVESSLKFSDRIEEYSLDNNLKVILIRDSRSPAVVSSIWYKVGSSYEYDGITGISHLLEHMMFKGTSITEPGVFSKKIKEVGGSENAFTGRDFTGYYQKIHKDFLELSLKLESDRMSNLVFNDNELKNEREVVKEERRLRTDDKPISKVFEKIGLQAFGVNAYGIPIIGSMKDIETISIEDLKKWYANFYVPNNATLIIAGDFDINNTKELIQKYYGKIPSKNVKDLTRKKDYVLSYSDIKVSDQISEPLVLLSFKNTPFDLKKKKEVYALELLLELMDGSSASRFTKNLVDTKKIALNTFISFDSYSKKDNLVTIGGSPRNGISPSQLKKAIFDEFRYFIKNGLLTDELSNTKSRLLANNIYKFDSVFYQAMQVGMLETKGFDWKLLDEYVKDINNVTENDLINIAKKIIINNDHIYSLIEPRS